MSGPFTLEQIQDFWAAQARTHQLSPSASWSDHPVIEMETREMVQRLDDGDRVLDVGCANGYTTVQLAGQKRIAIRGIDYISGMIEQAQARLTGLAGRLRGEVEFAVGNVLDLREPDDAYDKVICIRVIINLGAWSNQLQGLRECVRVLKPGGVFLLSEATVQGWNSLNRFRREWGLPAIPMPAFNHYLDQERVCDALAPAADLIEIVNFASTYYVGTRVLKPLLNRALGSIVDEAAPDMEWNRWFAELPARGDYGTQKLFVFRKK